MSTEWTEQAMSAEHSASINQTRLALTLLGKIVDGAAEAAEAQADGREPPGEHLDTALALGQHIAEIPLSTLNEIGPGLQRVAEVVELVLTVVALTAILRTQGAPAEEIKTMLATVAVEVRAKRAAAREG